MLPALLLLVTLLASKSQADRVIYDLEKAEQFFEEFITTHSKQYLDKVEKNHRFNIFKENLKYFNKKNAEGYAVFGINKFSDLSKEEFRKYYTGLSIIEDGNECTTVTDTTLEKFSKNVPEKLDWREKGAVTQVKNQGGCGSCWAFSTTGNLEGQLAIKKGKIEELSEQQLVDCDKDDDGCTGGFMTRAMMWFAKNGGPMSEQDYPYQGSETQCQYDISKAVVKVAGCKTYESISEDDLKNVLANVGPLSIGIAASGSISGYHRGVHRCDPDETHPHHAVLLVGYGKDGEDPYWLIKNSWGHDWGESGYIRLLMYKNSCGLMTSIVSAVLE